MHLLMIYFFFGQQCNAVQHLYKLPCANAFIVWQMVFPDPGANMFMNTLRGQWFFLSYNTG